MNPTLRELLDAADDPTHAEYPPGFDRAAMRSRVAALQLKLERIVGRAFVLDDTAQDASFCIDLTIQRPGPQPNWIDTVFAVRFSNFGELFTTWRHCQTEALSERVIAEVVTEVERAGFRYIPAAALDEAYSGRHPGVGRLYTWWIRFFDYV
jgi:hypothetical protein